MELSVRLARWEMKSMPSEVMVPHELIAIITKRMLGLMSWYWWRRECVAMARWAERRDWSVW